MLEYQPEPSNQWTTVGQLEAKRAWHAVLFIGPEALPCLEGCLKKDELFVESQYYHQVYHYHYLFHNHHPGCQNKSLYATLIRRKKLSSTNIHIDDHDHHIITTTTKTTSTDQSSEASIRQTQTKQKVDRKFLLAL